MTECCTNFLVEARPDLKICWFTITWPGLQETCQSKKILMLIPEKKFSATIYYPSYTYLENKVNFLSFASFFSCLCCFYFFYTLSSTQASLHCATLGRQINRWNSSAAAIRDTNDEESFQIWIEL